MSSSSMQALTDRRLRPGHQVGRYIVLDEVAGGMGVVYAAYDPELDRKVAIKIVGQAGSDPEVNRRLLREAQALGNSERQRPG